MKDGDRIADPAATGDPFAALTPGGRQRALEALYHLTLSLDPRPDLESMASRALGSILEFMRADGGIVYRVDRNGVVIPVASVNIGSQAAQDLAANPVRVGECLCGKIAGDGEEIVILDKASADPRVTRQSIREEGMEFYAGLPVTYGGFVRADPRPLHA